MGTTIFPQNSADTVSPTQCLNHKLTAQCWQHSRRHSVPSCYANTASSNFTVFNTAIPHKFWRQTQQKVCVWCVFENYTLSVHLAKLSICFYLQNGARGRNRTTDTRIFKTCDIFTSLKLNGYLARKHGVRYNVL